MNFIHEKEHLWFVQEDAWIELIEWLRIKPLADFGGGLLFHSIIQVRVIGNKIKYRNIWQQFC